MKKRLLSLLLAALMLFGVLGATALADDTPEPIAPAPADPITVLVAISVKGELVVPGDAVQVTDRDSSGDFNIDEVMAAAHDAYCPGGYASAVGDYGLGMTKLWNDDSGNFGYYVNDAGAWALTDPVKEGDFVYAYVYADGTGYSDQYAFFDSRVLASGENETTIPLTLKAMGFDANWAPVEQPVAGAVITVDGKETEFVTDAEGKVTVTVSGYGRTVISAKSDKTLLVPPVCVVKFPAKPIDVFVSVSVKGELAVPIAAVTVKDLDVSGDFSVDEALIAAHEQLFEGGAEGYASTNGWVTRFWGDDSGFFSFYVNDVGAWSSADEVQDGDYLYGYIYKDTETWSDTYSSFDGKRVITANHEVTFPLILNAAVYDMNAGTTVPQPLAGAVITVDGKETEFVTDAEGEVTVTVSGEDCVVISAKSADMNIVPPVCVVYFGAVPYKDVAPTDWFYDDVLWAVANSITNGTSKTTFSPDAPCTRAQVVTFLWRASGCPEPVGTKMPFADVKQDAYYYKAVQWAVENGITKGTSETAFSPDSACTRGQVVTFLWRTAQEPAVDGVENPFKDLAKGAYYEDAVLWAVENEITNGTSATTFSPEKTCTRAQIVAFLHRWDVNVVPAETPAPADPDDPADPADPAEPEDPEDPKDPDEVESVQLDPDETDPAPSDTMSEEPAPGKQDTDNETEEVPYI
ncbi:MAG: S-layer homology domain-containing protein [Oscillospiraceae bacterium]|nr:S-layer homology domain-containing protein [Oscillospiraceae bacterium]